MKIVMPLADGFEDCEFSVPLHRLKAAGHEVLVVGEQAGKQVRGKQGHVVALVESTVDGLAPQDFGALVIVGGHAPDRLRLDERMVDFVARFARSGRPIAAICHGPQLLIEAEAVKGRKLTSWPSVRKDLENAGAEWLDQPLVEDGNLITSRKPEDLGPFCDALLRVLADAEPRTGTRG